MEKRCLDEPPELNEPGGASAKIERESEAAEVLDGMLHRTECRA